MDKIKELYRKLDELFLKVEKMTGEYPSDVFEAYDFLDMQDTEESYELSEEIREIDEKLEELESEDFIDDENVLDEEEEI